MISTALEKGQETRISVLFNALIMTGGAFGYATVIQCYLNALADAFRKGIITGIDLQIVCQKRALLQIDPQLKLRNSPNIKFIVVPDMHNVLLRSIFELIFLNLAALIRKCDIIHMPATLGLMASLKPQLLFFHASTTFKLERRMHGRSRLSTWLQNIVIRHSAKTAELLAVTTRTTAEELLEFLRERRDYHVIGNGVKGLAKNSHPVDLESLLDGRRYALYVSSFYELKNQQLLVSTFSQRDNSDGLCLVLVGGRAQPEYFEQCQELARGKSNIFFLDNVGDDALAWLYRRCTIYVNPSLFEGFSLTPLEALSVDRPILLSDIPVHKEVYGEEFHYFDPHSSKSLDSALTASVSNSYEKRCKTLGAPLLEKHSWDAFAINNVALYRRLLGRFASENS